MANIFRKIFGGSTSGTRAIEGSGAFGAPDSGRLARFAESRLTGGPSDIFQTLQSELLAPQFGPRSDVEESFISSIADIAGGRSAGRGLGIPSFGGVAQTIAPALQGLRQQRVSNLSQALGQETTGRGQTLQGLMQLIQLAQPKLGQFKEEDKGIGGVLSGLGSAAGGAAALLPLLCWVAETLYGVDHPKTHLARLYANTHDTWFLRLYRKHGKSWARCLENHKWLQPIIKPIWDLMAYKGALMLREDINGKAVI